MKIQTALLSLVLVCVTTFASAQTVTPRVKKHQVSQQKRIIKGAANGKLTKKEVKELKLQQRRINRSKCRAKADGKITAKERAVLNARQKKASNNIYRKKHN